MFFWCLQCIFCHLLLLFLFKRLIKIFFSFLPRWLLIEFSLCCDLIGDTAGQTHPPVYILQASLFPSVVERRIQKSLSGCLSVGVGGSPCIMTDLFHNGSKDFGAICALWVLLIPFLLLSAVMATLKLCNMSLIWCHTVTLAGDSLLFFLLLFLLKHLTSQP